jgi:hypothetical protein
VIGIKVNVRGLERLADRLGQERLARLIDNFFAMSAEELQRQVMANAPMRTGALIKSIGIVKLGEAHYAVGSPLEYALYQEVGTRPHMIYPREAEVLAFEVGGQVVFARYVRHPGFPGRRYFAKAVGEYLRVAGEIFRRAMGAVKA